MKESMMNAPKNHRQSEARLANQDTGREEQEMSAPKTGIQSKLQAAFQETWKDEEKIEMWITSNISKVKAWVSQSLATRRPIKLLGMLALGTLMITVTALQFVPSQADDSSSYQPVLIPGAPAALVGGITDFEEPYVNAVMPWTVAAAVSASSLPAAEKS